MTQEPKDYAVAITTFDNPYDPFDQFDEWFLFDVEKGYNTCGHLGRLTKTEDDMTQKEEAEDIERAIDRMIELDFMNIYKKVKKELKNPEEDTEEE